MAKAKKLEAHENQGHLFPQMRRDYNPFWMSSLFSDVYLKNDVPRVYKHLWENDEIENSESGFAKFYQGFVDLAIHHENSKFESWNEAQTVKDWIVPIMDLLGWENNSVKGTNSYLDNETFNIENQTYKPDLIYFDKPKFKEFTQKHKKDVTLKLNEIRNSDTGAKMVVEAKHWNRLTSNRNEGKKDAKLTDSAVSLGPELQTLKYMEVLGLEFGILTDGKIWKLFHKDLSKSVDKRSFTFDLGKLKEIAQDLYSHGQEEIFRVNAKYFYYFFAKPSFYQVDDSKVLPIVREVFEHSKKYAHDIEEDLKKRFIITMGLTCNALKNSCKRQKEEVDLETIRNVAESHLFNILFVKSCEVRQILPIKSPNYLKVSLHEVIEYLDYMHFDPEKGLDTFFKYFQTGTAFGGKEFTYDGFQIFDRFINLYEIIHDGTSKSKDFGFEIEGFKESIFTNVEWNFASKHKITNGEMIKILFTLNFIESSVPGRNYQQIPYSYFTPRQLGSIYESFLDYQLEKAEVGMIFQKGQWQKANIKSNQVKKLNLVDSHIVGQGELFFSPNNKERKMTGSYYTPDYIVKHIIESTLGPLVNDRTSNEILNLKVCDPAMGSGHFLAGVLDFLVEAYRRKWSEETNDDLEESIESTSRKILDSCIYGVDINPRSVKLANMSLWLMTAYAGKKLEKLNDQLIVADTIIDKVLWKREISFDAIVGNPPYFNLQGYDNYKKFLKGSTIYDPMVNIQGDIVYYFIFRSILLLKPQGILGLISSRYFLENNHSSKLRKWLSAHATVLKIVDFGVSQIFNDASIHTAILLIEKKLPSVLHEISFFDEKFNLSGSVPQNKLGENKWCNSLSINSFTTKNILLGDIFHIYKGVETGLNRAFVISDTDLNNNVNLKKIAIPIIRNSDIGKHKLKKKSGKYLLFVSDAYENNKMPVDLNKWLTQFKDELSNRPEVLQNKYPWYRIRRSRKEYKIHEVKEKIFIPYRAKENLFYLDRTGSVGLSDVTIISPAVEMTSNILLAYQCLLNSKYFKEYFNKFGKKKGNIIEFLPEELRLIKLPDFRIESEFFNKVIKYAKNEDYNLIEGLLSGVASIDEIDKAA